MADNETSRCVTIHPKAGDRAEISSQVASFMLSHVSTHTQEPERVLIFRTPPKAHYTRAAIESMPFRGLCGQDIILDELSSLWRELPQTQRPPIQALSNNPALVRSMPGVDTRIDAIFTKIQAKWTRHNPLRVMAFAAKTSMGHLLRRVDEHTDQYSALQRNPQVNLQRNDQNDELQSILIMLVLQLKVFVSLLITIASRYAFLSHHHQHAIEFKPLDIRELQIQQTKCDYNDPRHERNCLEVVLAVQMKVLHSVLRHSNELELES